MKLSPGLFLICAIVVGACGQASGGNTAQMESARASATAIIREANAQAKADRIIRDAEATAVALKEAAEQRADVAAAAPMPTNTPNPTNTPDPTATSKSAKASAPKSAKARVAKSAKASAPKPTDTARPEPTSTPIPAPTETPDTKAERTSTLYVDIVSDGFDLLNIRARPSKQSAILAQAAHGDRLSAAEETVTGDDGQQWAAVTYAGKDGYTLRSLLSVQAPMAASDSIGERTKTLYVDISSDGFDWLNIRAKPSKQAAVLARAAHGDSLLAVEQTVTGDDGQQWIAVTYAGQDGYTLRSLLSTQQPESQVAEEPEDEPATGPPPSTADDGDVPILSDTSYTDDVSYTHVVGEVRNDTDTPITYVEIVGTFYDGGGRVVGTDFTYAEMEYIEPGQKAPFDLLSDELGPWKRYKLDVNWETTSTKQLPGLKILSSSSYLDDIGAYHIVGEVKNSSSRRRTYVKLVATIYDKRGNVIATDFTYTDPEDIASGATAPFDLIVGRENINVGRYSIQVEGE